MGSCIVVEFSRETVHSPNIEYQVCWPPYTIVVPLWNVCDSERMGFKRYVGHARENEENVLSCCPVDMTVWQSQTQRVMAKHLNYSLVCFLFASANDEKVNSARDSIKKPETNEKPDEQGIASI